MTWTKTRQYSGVYLRQGMWGTGNQGPSDEATSQDLVLSVLYKGTYDEAVLLWGLDFK